MTRVLVVEDNANLAFAVTTALQSEGFDVVLGARRLVAQRPSAPHL